MTSSPVMLPPPILRTLPSCVAALRWRLQSLTALQLLDLGVTSQTAADLTLLSGEDLRGSPLLRGATGLLEHLLAQALETGHLCQVGTTLVAGLPEFGRLWNEGLALSIEANRSFMKAELWDGVYSEEVYIAPLHVLPVAGAIGQWMDGLGAQQLVKENVHAQLALWMHRVFIEAAAGRSESAYYLKAAAESALYALARRKHRAKVHKGDSRVMSAVRVADGSLILST
jgi:hypothetical protein